MMSKNKDDIPVLKYVEPYVHSKIIIAIILMLIVGSCLLWIGFKNPDSLFYYLLKEIGKAILITALVSSTIKWYFGRQFSLIEEEKEKFEKEKDELFRQELNTQLTILRKEVLNQTKEIASKAICFDAIQAANVDRFYRSRDEASEDIKNALMRDGVESIKVIGISLNDFMRDENEKLHSAWMALMNFVKKNELPANTEKLDIKILIIDPRSNGAYLRCKAEGREGSETRLPSDVNDTIRDFLYLEQKASSNDKVTFAARLYRTCPIIHLIWTPHIAFVQPYHFRPRHTKGHIPIIKYHHSGESDCMHQELEFHFDWIWANASIPIHDHTNMYSFGVDEAIREANINNIFYDYQESKLRIIELIKKTKDILWIKGISLHAFFTHGELYDSIVDACIRGVDVRVLLLNPICEQAKLRSFREHLLSNPDSLLSTFNDSAREAGRLFTDTKGSINFIKSQLMRRINLKDNFKVRLFYSSPEAFTLLTDDEVLVEQYHYGKIVDSSIKNRPDVILGGDVPVVEYKRISLDQLIDKKKDPYKLFRNNFDKKKDPYKLFRDNFDYVFKNCSTGLEDFKQ